MTTTWTTDAEAKLREYLADHDLPTGLGDKESACSIAAINLALTGELTDDIPDCMSAVIGKATIVLQDAMPDDLRNSERYKAWLPTAAGTGRDCELQRLAVLLDWMWSTVLPRLQSIADEKGFGEEWHKMCHDKTDDAAAYAGDAAYAAAYAADAAACASYAADAATYADYDAAARAATYAAYAAAYAAYASYAAARAVSAAFWNDVDPIAMLENMTTLGEPK